jgi:hypothetical protein
MTNRPNGSTTHVTEPVTAGVVLRKGPRNLRPPRQVEPVSRDAQRVAAAVLEVLAGVRTPSDAAAAMGVSVPRYYLWEQRALAGLVMACEPRPVGKMPGSRHQVAVLEKEIVGLKQECARQHALVRAAQRTIGLAPPPTPKPVPKGGGRSSGKKPRKRRPVVRALKAAAILRSMPLAEEASGSLV